MGAMTGTAATMRLRNAVWITRHITGHGFSSAEKFLQICVFSPLLCHPDELDYTNVETASFAGWREGCQ